MDPNEAQEGKGSAEHKKEDKNYIKSKAKWKDFNIHNDIIEALND